MKFNFSKKVTFFSIILSLVFFRLAYWQWERHLEKKGYILELENRLRMPILEYNKVKNISNFNDYIHRRVEVKGSYDFDREIIINNRRHNEMPGVFLVTPLKLINSNFSVLVNRGFIPFSEKSKDKREKFKKPANLVSLTTLVKETKREKFLAPRDPDNSLKEPKDTWSRINVVNIQKQIPYKLLPVYLEIMPNKDIDKALSSVISSSKGKDEILNLAIKGVPSAPSKETDWSKYPIEKFSTVIAPGRHFGYVFEWSFMGILTLVISFVLQIKRFRK